MVHFGCRNPEELAQLSMFEAVSSKRAFFSRASLSAPGQSWTTCLPAPLAKVVSRSRRAFSLLKCRHFIMARTFPRRKAGAQTGVLITDNCLRHSVINANR
jgi:hypothetical protein